MTSKKCKNKELFHPLEISFCGYSNSGKSTLISRLIERLADDLDIGYIKHDAHRFEMDREGKDTWRAKEAGAKLVSITSDDQNACIQANPADIGHLKFALADMDVVFIEGYKKSLGKKLLVLGEGHSAEKTLKELKEGAFENVIALVGSASKCPVDEIPYFQRDNIDQIIKFLNDAWSQEINKRPLYGLVLGGGKSVRMGQDKGALDYFGKGQAEYLWEILSKHTSETFISCRSEQSAHKHLLNLPQIEDRFIGFGPSGGILSAMEKHPDASWLVLACDLPYLDEATIENLLGRRNPFKVATCYENPKRKWPEPLCTIYEPKAKLKLGMFLAQGRPCPRKVLFNSNIELLDLKNESALLNVNTPEQYEKALGRVGNFKPRGDML